MNKSQDAKAEEIIDVVTERSGLSRDIVRSVVDHIRSVIPVTSVEPVEAPFEARRIPEIRFELTDSNRSTKGVDRQRFATNRSKLGGSAEWMHDSRTPVCCGRFATFYAQIDTNLGPDISIVDAGVLYVFVCDQCLATFTELQYH
jgi:hypothetical protein